MIFSTPSRISRQEKKELAEFEQTKAGSTERHDGQRTQRPRRSRTIDFVPHASMQQAYSKSALSPNAGLREVAKINGFQTFVQCRQI